MIAEKAKRLATPPCFVSLIFSLILFGNPLFAGDKAKPDQPLEPIIPQGATVRGATQPFETTIAGKKTFFENGIEFNGQVLWLDQYYLDLNVPYLSDYLKIPFKAITKIEMKAEKKNLPVAIATGVGFAAGAAIPIDDDEDRKNTQALTRIVLIAGGTAAGFVAGLIVKYSMPSQWIDVPLEQARLGIRK